MPDMGIWGLKPDGPLDMAMGAPAMGGAPNCDMPLLMPLEGGAFMRGMEPWGGAPNGAPGNDGLPETIPVGTPMPMAPMDGCGTLPPKFGLPAIMDILMPLLPMAMPLPPMFIPLPPMFMPGGARPPCTDIPGGRTPGGVVPVRMSFTSS